MSYSLKDQVAKLSKRIAVMEEKYEADPCWINETLLNCMLLDYESKLKLLIQDGQTEI